MWYRYFQILTLPFQIIRAVVQRVQATNGDSDLYALRSVDGHLRPGTSVPLYVLILYAASNWAFVGLTDCRFSILHNSFYRYHDAHPRTPRPWQVVSVESLGVVLYQPSTLPHFLTICRSVHIQAQQLPQLQGTVLFNGMTASDAAQQGIYLKHLVNYTDQLDQHIPYLTVRETLGILSSVVLISFPSTALLLVDFTVDST